MPRSLRRAFTILELLVAIGLTAILGYAAWELYISGTKVTTTATEHLSSLQNAFILMENIQEDTRQMSILNEYGMQLVPYSMMFSTNGKSFMLRKSTLKDTAGNQLGSSFTVVLYQLMEHPTQPGVFTIRRLEKAADGRPIQGEAGRDQDEKAFQSLLLKDIRWDLVVRLENMAYRTFIRVSISAVNSSGGARDPKLHFLSNLFEVSSPEFIHNYTNPTRPGFARRFIMSQRWAAPTEDVKPGRGYYNVLPPPSWPDVQKFMPFRDYQAKDGSPKDVDLGTQPTVQALNPYDTSSFSAPPKRRAFVTSSVTYFSQLLGPSFRGRILGQVVPRTAPGVRPAWVEPFGLDASINATKTLAAQLNDLVGKIIPKGPEAVQELGHMMYAQVTPADPMITLADAQAIVGGQ